MSDKKMEISVESWGIVWVVLIVLIFAYEKVDCAIGVQSACENIEESYGDE